MILTSVDYFNIPGQSSLSIMSSSAWLLSSLGDKIVLASSVLNVGLVVSRVYEAGSLSTILFGTA